MAMGERPSKIKSAAQVDYYTKDNAHEAETELGAYYGHDGTLEQSDRMLSGRWYDPHGITSKNLNGQIICESDFRNILDGRDPELIDDKTGELQKLVRNSGAENRTMGIDMSLSPPKPVTLLWVAADENMKRVIEKIQHDAALAAVKFADDNLVVTRRGAGGAVEEKAHGAYALFDHKTARPSSDLVAPQLHTHCIFSGMVRAQDGTMLALQEKKLMNWRSAFENIYHAELADGLKKLGYEVEVEIGKTAFRIKGMEKFQDACEALSPRTAQIKKNIEEKFEGKEYKDLSRAEYRLAVMHDRANKVELERSELDWTWEKAINEVGTTTDDVRNFMRQAGSLAAKKQEFSMAPEQIALLRDQVAAELHEKNSTFKEGVLYGRIAFHMQGKCGREDIDYVFSSVKGGLISIGVDKHGEQLFASEAQVALERRMVEQAQAPTPQHVMDRGYVNALIASKQTPELVEKKRAMTEAQAHAVREMLCGHGSARLVGISEGSAGAGKSFSADLLREAFEGRGYTVTGLCLGWKQAQNLSKEAHLEHSKAITGWINDVEKGRLKINQKTAILIDEGGLVDSKNMARLVSVAHAAGAKIVLTGDTRQLNPIGGAAMKTLVNELGSTRIGDTAEEIRRQTNPLHAQAGLDIAKGEAGKAVELYRQNGHFTISKNREESMNALVAAVKTARETNPEKSQIIIANTRADVRKLNVKLRDMKRELGEIKGKDHEVQCGDGDTVKYMAKLAVGEVIQFRDNQKERGIWNRDIGTITKIDNKGEAPVFHVTLENGKETTFSAVPGNPVFDEQSGSLKIEPAHCQTVFSSQGATVDQAYVFDSANLDRRLAYVAMTRFREDVRVFVDRQSSHEKIVTPDDWRAPSAISEDEIFRNISQRWTHSEEKQSTYDLLKKSAYDLSKTDEEKIVTVESIRQENQKIITSAQLAHEATREFKAFEDRETARKLTPITTREASNDLIFDHTKELNYGQLQLARRAAIYQSNAVEAGPEPTTDTIASVRDLSRVGLVFEQNGTEMLLHENEPHQLGQESRPDPAMRRTGVGDPRPQSQASEVVATEAVIEQPAAEQPAVALGFPYFGPAPESALYPLIGSSPLIVTTTRENALAISKQELKANSAATTVAVANEFDDILRSPTIREAIQNPNRDLVFAGDVDEKTKSAVLKIAAEIPPQKIEHSYRDILLARSERDINLPVL